MRGWSVALLGTLLSSGCPSLGAYFCSAAADCDRGGQPGVCLADNTCAYPDTTGQCESGLVRSPNADRDPGGCVPGSDATTTGPDTAADSGEVSTSAPAPTSESTAVGDASEGSTASDSSGDDGPATCPHLLVTIDTNAVSSTEALVGYPLLVRIEDATVAGQLHRGADTLRVLDPTGTELAVEIVPAAVDEGAFSAWVRLGEYAPGALLGLDLHWQGTPSAMAPAAVWADRYAGVWHFDDVLDGADDTPIQNSAVLSEPGLTRGSMGAEQSTPLVVGHGIAFDGVDDSIDIDAAFLGQLSSYTISMWARMDADYVKPLSSYFNRLNGDGLYPRCWRLLNGNIFCQSKTGDDQVVAIIPDEAHPMGTTLRLTLSRDGDAGVTSIYVNGQLRDTTDDASGEFAAGDLPLQIGNGEWGSSTATFDEVRVSEEMLPASWVAADYATMINPAATIQSVADVDMLPCL